MELPYCEHVLVLGDGNFSFSLALSKYLQGFEPTKNNHPWTGTFLRIPRFLTATSFDSYKDVVSKYPESSSILSSLMNMGESTGLCRVQHSINATKNLIQQIGDGEYTNLSGRRNLDASQSSILFDSIIFNFPHLGVEDEQAHASLLGHIFFRAYEALTPSGQLYISLADNQPLKWSLMEMAKKNHFALVKCCGFQPRQLPGYELRRHQIGRSFSSRVHSCSYHIFRKIIDYNERGHLTPPTDLIGDLILSHDVPFRNVVLSDDDGSHTADESTPQEMQSINEISGTCVVDLNSDKKLSRKRMRGKSRGKMAQAELLYRPVSRNAPSYGGPILSEDQDGTQYHNKEDGMILRDLLPAAKIVYECIICQLRFDSEQGARTHAYMNHILTVSSSTPTGGESELSRSSNKSNQKVDSSTRNALSSDKAALGKLPSETATDNKTIRLSTDAGSSLFNDSLLHNTSIVADATTEVKNKDSSRNLFECIACNLSFQTQDLLNDHMNNGVSPPELIPLVCNLCLRPFINARALTQHSMRCMSINADGKRDENEMSEVVNADDGFAEIEDCLHELVSSPVMQLLKASWIANIQNAMINSADEDIYQEYMKKYAEIFSSGQFTDVPSMLEIYKGLIVKIESLSEHRNSQSIDSPITIFHKTVKCLLISLKYDFLNGALNKGQLLGLLAETLSVSHEVGLINVDILSTRGRLFSASAALGFEGAKAWMLKMKNGKKVKKL